MFRHGDPFLGNVESSPHYGPQWPFSGPYKVLLESQRWSPGGLLGVSSRLLGVSGIPIFILMARTWRKIDGRSAVGCPAFQPDVFRLQFSISDMHSIRRVCVGCRPSVVSWVSGGLWDSLGSSEKLAGAPPWCPAFQPDLFLGFTFAVAFFLWNFLLRHHTRLSPAVSPTQRAAAARTHIMVR